MVFDFDFPNPIICSANFVKTWDIRQAININKQVPGNPNITEVRKLLQGRDILYLVTIDTEFIYLIGENW